MSTSSCAIRPYERAGISFLLNFLDYAGARRRVTTIAGEYRDLRKPPICCEWGCIVSARADYRLHFIFSWPTSSSRSTIRRAAATRPTATARQRRRERYYHRSRHSVRTAYYRGSVSGEERVFDTHRYILIVGEKSI